MAQFVSTLNAKKILIIVMNHLFCVSETPGKIEFISPEQNIDMVLSKRKKKIT